jgi:hypothetical protein
MRLFEIYQQLNELSSTPINKTAPVEKTPIGTVKSAPVPNIVRPTGFEYTLPRTFVFPDMNGFEFYRFVIALASYPELNKSFFEFSPLRDIPMAIARSDQEAEMIKTVAKLIGKKYEVLSTGSKEEPRAGTASPVMTFKMTEAQFDITKSLLECIDKD